MLLKLATGKGIFLNSSVILDWELGRIIFNDKEGSPLNNWTLMVLAVASSAKETLGISQP